jgi:hypothetical protein
MWAPDGKQIESNSLGDLRPTEVLFEFEEPLTFVCRDREGQMLLAHNLCAESFVSRYLVSVTDERVIDDLKAGRLDVLGALRQPRCWIVDFGPDWEIRGLWFIAFDKVPKDHLPNPGAMLTPDLDPLFRLRLVGPGVGPGRTSAADVRMAAQAAESGLRGLARIAHDQKKRTGQVPKNIRYYSDLPYQYSRAASFEIAFGRPRDRLPAVDDEVFREMGNLLEQGLSALRANRDEPASVEGLDEDQAVQLFEAIKALTPPMKGGVDRIEIGGELVEAVSSPRVLTRDDRIRSSERIKAASKPPRKDAPFRISGVIEEADQGTFSFTLRQLDPAETVVVNNAVEISFAFDDHLFDAVSDAWNSQERVFVVGERIGTDCKALNIRAATDSSGDWTKPEQQGSE